MRKTNREGSMPWYVTLALVVLVIGGFAKALTYS
jgi:hypothetical protein